MRSFHPGLWHAWLELIMTSGWFATQFVSMSSVVQLDSRSLYLHLQLPGWCLVMTFPLSRVATFVEFFVLEVLVICASILRPVSWNIESEHQQALPFAALAPTMTTCWQSSWIAKEWLVWCVSIVCSSTMPGLMELLCERLWMRNGWCAGCHLQSSWYVGYKLQYVLRCSVDLEVIKSLSLP
jgi:hypothetical protein